MKYKFTDEQWDTTKTILTNEMVKVNDPNYEWDFDTYNDATDAMDQCFGVDEYFEIENQIDDRSVPKIAKEIVEHFCDTDDMGEYMERHSYVMDLLRTTFEENSKLIQLTKCSFS